MAMIEKQMKMMQDELQRMRDHLNDAPDASAGEHDHEHQK